MTNVMRTEYRKLSESEKELMTHIKRKGLEFYQLLETCGTSREIALAKTKVEEAVMWAVKYVTG